MHRIDDFSDTRLRTWCIHCSKTLIGNNISRDHVPSKCLLLDPYPANLPLVDVCKTCNHRYSLDEEYFINFLEAVIAGSTDADFIHNPAVARAFARNKKLKDRIDKSRIEYETLGGETKVYWKPEIKRVKNVLLKNAVGHVYYELSESSRGENAEIAFYPLASLTAYERESFEETLLPELWPEIGSRMFTRMLTGQDFPNGWVIVQKDIYRYAISFEGSGIRVKTVMKEYLASEVLFQSSE